MASVPDRFANFQRDYPFHSSFINFQRAIRGQNITRKRVRFYFRKFVEKDDYAKKDASELLEILISQTHDAGIRVKKASKEPKSTKNALHDARGSQVPIQQLQLA